MITEAWVVEDHLLGDAERPLYSLTPIATMQSRAELPDSHVVCHAEQFLNAAELLLSKVPHVIAPSPIRVNSAFAIELFIKSLDSHWEEHDLGESLGIEGVCAVTTVPNIRGHNLLRLFKDLPDPVRISLSSAFIKSALASRYRAVEDILSIYAHDFELERYAFERWSIDNDSRPMKEIVDLARFFRDYVKSLAPRRYFAE